LASHGQSLAEHGVTTLIMGNCSVSLAPVKAQDRDTLIGWFGCVENLEGRLLRDALPFSWESVSDYLGYRREGLGPNVGVGNGHAVIRAAAFGLAFIYNHLDDRGGELPCFFDARKEIGALMEDVAAADRMVEVAPHFRSDAAPSTCLAACQSKRGARVTLSPILMTPNPHVRWDVLLTRLEHWRRRARISSRRPKFACSIFP
jgi:hypothetical protein